MLASQMMSSYGGQQNFPFGYDPNAIGGIGLPTFLTPPPGHPTGQPLLNDFDNKAFHNFLTHFDQNDPQALSSLPQSDFHQDPNHDQTWTLPPTFVGSETSLGPRSAVDPNHLQMGAFIDGSLPGGDMGQMGHGQQFANSINPSISTFGDHSYPDHILHQLQNAASSAHPYGQGWQQPYPQNFVPMHGPGRPMPRFGSDSHFQPGGYTAPDGHVAPDLAQMQELSWLEAQSSATNTQPNTRPNTQPSSPNLSRKRKLGDYEEGMAHPAMSGLPNGHRLAPQSNLLPPTNPQRRKSIKPEHGSPAADSRASTPLANGQPDIEADSDHDPDADAEAESDHDTKPSSQPSFWPTNKPRPSSKPLSMPKPSKPRKSTASSSSHQPIKPGPAKSRASRRSSTNNSTTGTASHMPRTVLTAEQKKANHTNSEQRRRDMTQRRNAELFDMVPELEPLGKASTFKKMAVVVDKLERVKASVVELRKQYEMLTGREWTGIPVRGGG